MSTIDYLKGVCDAHPPLQRDEEQKLGFRIQGGDEKARETLILHNVALVFWVAEKYRYAKWTKDKDDLYSAGMMGLTEVAGRYDPTRGRFANLAILRIRQRMVSHLLKAEDTIRLSDEMKKKLLKWRAEGDENDQEMQQLERLTHPVWLEMPAGERDSGVTLADTIGVEDAEPVHMDFHAAKRALARLTPRLRGVVELKLGFYGPGGDGKAYTLEEIGQIYGVTKERTRQLFEEALQKLRVLIQVMGTEETAAQNTRGCQMELAIDVKETQPLAVRKRT